jgi:hypothetical protein
LVAHATSTSKVFLDIARWYIAEATWRSNIRALEVT